MRYHKFLPNFLWFTHVDYFKFKLPKNEFTKNLLKFIRAFNIRVSLKCKHGRICASMHDFSKLQFSWIKLSISNNSIQDLFNFIAPSREIPNNSHGLIQKSFKTKHYHSTKSRLLHSRFIQVSSRSSFKFIHDTSSHA